MENQKTLNIDINSLLFLQLRELQFKHLVVNNTLVAGFKVCSKLGGSEMLVEGFIADHNESYFIKDARVWHKVWTQNHSVPCYEKVQLNTSNLTNEEIFNERTYKRNPGTDSLIRSFLFYDKIFDFTVDETANSVLLFCKFRVEGSDRFDHKLVKLFEVDYIKS